ncbi:MAG: GntR family transcriptional regulator [Thermovirgaceae bacterium]
MYRSLMDQIISGRLRAGQRLPTTGLAEKFGTSRMPVRQALQRLADEGIVIQRPGYGACLVSPSPKEIRDVYAVRVILETAALDLAFANLNGIRLAQLEESVSRQKKMREQSFQEYLKWDLVFHRTIAEAADNAFLKKEVDNALSASNAYRILFENKSGKYRSPVPEEEHHEIFLSICNGQKKMAKDLLQRHIFRGTEDLVFEDPAGLGGA